MRVLVAIASTYGATAEIGEAIAVELRQGGHHVEVRPVEAVGRLDPYDGVVLGSAVYIGRILTSARQFAARLAEEFAPRPVWVFASGMKSVTPYPLGAAFTSPVQPPYFGGRYTIFGGVVDRSKLGTAERSLIGFVGATHSDERDFDLIAAWSGEVSVRMNAYTARRRAGETRSIATPG
ncbi:flavodoxin domain-containing protein [Occultella aeris]|uniref:Flavodoxin domain protein n=1 Tax=Occultella aeris TaxID=2761496 RepID=A0A7M4DQ51_9MICO|nr:flavodoxin domain-containing protein [Occultella aeris]VZO39595.1 Flavodoxin domain protein [Occultella aeris]